MIITDGIAVMDLAIIQWYNYEKYVMTMFEIGSFPC